jgi:hypothetical protein
MKPRQPGNCNNDVALSHGAKSGRRVLEDERISNGAGKRYHSMPDPIATVVSTLSSSERVLFISLLPRFGQNVNLLPYLPCASKRGNGHNE